MCRVKGPVHDALQDVGRRRAHRPRALLRQRQGGEEGPPPGRPADVRPPAVQLDTDHDHAEFDEGDRRGRGRREPPAPPAPRRRPDPAAAPRRYARSGMAKAAKKKVAPGDVASNRQARHRFELLDKLECGMVLQGTEVKALRESGATLKDAYAQIRSGELWLYNAHIPPYGPAARENHEPERPRKLLAHRREIERLGGEAAAPGPDARPDADLLQGPEREDRDRARQGQGPLRQAPVDQGARDEARHGSRAARGQPLGACSPRSASTASAAASASSSSPRTSRRPLSQKPGSARSSPAIAARSSGLREPPAASMLEVGAGRSPRPPRGSGA